MGIEIKKKVVKQFEFWYERKHRYAFERRLEAVAKSMRPRKEHLILDAGTGDGEMLLRLIKNYNCFGIGLDISPSLVFLAKTLARISPSHFRIDFLVGDVECLPLRSACVNHVYSAATLEHVPNPFKAIKGFKRVVKHGGKIVITTPNPLYEPMFKIASWLRMKYREEGGYRLSAKVLRLMAEKADLTVKALKGFTLFPLPISFVERVEERLAHKFSEVKNHNFFMNQLLILEKP